MRVQEQGEGSRRYVTLTTPQTRIGVVHIRNLNSTPVIAFFKQTCSFTSVRKNAPKSFGSRCVVCALLRRLIVSAPGESY